MAKRWRILPHDPDRIANLARAASVPAVVAQLLICRQITEPDCARAFLDAKLSALRDPNELPGCTQAAQRIRAAVADGQRIVVHGDYDVDGMTATAILWLCLKLLGANVGYYVPHRVDEGYGLSSDTVRTLASNKAQLIVTVDCGVTAIEQAALARELGLTLIVTDHHEPGPRLPDCAAVVHPRLPGANYPFGGLSGAGVALKLAWAICQQVCGEKKVPQRMKDFLLQAVGLAALGTIADVVPLVDENRVLVRRGLESLVQRPTLGMSTLMRLTGLADKQSLDAEDVAFTLAPRLNAAGRLEQAQLAVELLVTDRPERAQELAQYIDQLNATRQSLERSIYLAAGKQLKENGDPDRAALVLADRGWHPGVIGIVAGKLAERYHRPVILVAWDKIGVKPGVGSARSVPGFDLHGALAACARHLVTYGGHAAAAGLKIEEPNFEAFGHEFCEHAAERLGHSPTPELVIDAETPLSAFTPQIVGQIEQLAPFGHGNARPLLCASGVSLAEPPRAMGEGGRHLSLRLTQHGVSLRTVAFGAGEDLEALTALTGPLDVAFRPVINAFRGQRKVELHLVDWRSA